MSSRRKPFKNKRNRSSDEDVWVLSSSDSDDGTTLTSRRQSSRLKQQKPISYKPYFKKNEPLEEEERSEDLVFLNENEDEGEDEDEDYRRAIERSIRENEINEQNAAHERCLLADFKREKKERKEEKRKEEERKEKERKEKEAEEEKRASLIALQKELTIAKPSSHEKTILVKIMLPNGLVAAQWSIKTVLNVIARWAYFQSVSLANDDEDKRMDDISNYLLFQRDYPKKWITFNHSSSLEELSIVQPSIFFLRHV